MVSSCHPHSRQEHGVVFCSLKLLQQSKVICSDMGSSAHLLSSSKSSSSSSSRTQRYSRCGYPPIEAGSDCIALVQSYSCWYGYAVPVTVLHQYIHTDAGTGMQQLWLYCTSTVLLMQVWVCSTCGGNPWCNLGVLWGSARSLSLPFSSSSSSIII